MSCSNLTAGIAAGCNDQVGGIKKAWYTTWSPENKQPALGFNAQGLVNQILFIYSFDAVRGIELDNGFASFTEVYDLNPGPRGGILGFQQTLQFMIEGPDTGTFSSPAWVDIMTKNNKLVMIVQDNNDNYWLFGDQRGAAITAGTKETGVQYGDMSGYTLDITAYSKYSILQVAPEYMIGL
jgi:hypothetical protein